MNEFQFLSEDTKKIITEGVKKYCDKNGNYIVPEKEIDEIILPDKEVKKIFSYFKVKTVIDVHNFLHKEKKIENYIDLKYHHKLENRFGQLIINDFDDELTFHNLIILDDLLEDLAVDFPDSLKSVGYSGNIKVNMDYILYNLYEKSKKYV